MTQNEIDFVQANANLRAALNFEWIYLTYGDLLTYYNI